jgi:putative holliday junction resolvase
VRTLGIDLGTRRVGLALSDAGGRFATPYEVVQVTSPEQARDQILKVIEREGVERIVLGLPLNMDDSLGPAARQTAIWGRELAEKSGRPVVFVDERLSSFEAEQSLIDRKRGGEKITRKRKKAQLDALAAAGFLQAFLDGKLPAIEAG